MYKKSSFYLNAKICAQSNESHTDNGPSKHGNASKLPLKSVINSMHGGHLRIRPQSPHERRRRRRRRR